jgi:hypothetical protein
MSTKSIPSTKPPRISVRIEARQNRKEEPAWITPTANNEEKRLLVTTLMEHLREYTTDIAVLRYITKEYWSLAPTMNTIPTLKKVRARLLELGVGYVRYNKEDTRLWTYWNDYSEDGMAAWTAKTVSPQDLSDEQRMVNPDPDEGQQVLTQNTSDEEGSQSGRTATIRASPDPPADKDPPATVRASYATAVSTYEQGYQEEAYKSDAPSTQSPPLLLNPPTGQPTDWFQSPPRVVVRNPYTGQMMQTPLPTRLHQMVQEL